MRKGWLPPQDMGGLCAPALRAAGHAAMVSHRGWSRIQLLVVVVDAAEAPEPPRVLDERRAEADIPEDAAAALL